MLTAHRPSVWSSRYEISVDGRPVGGWKWSAFGGTAELDLAGRGFTVEASGVLRRRFRLLDEQGTSLAETESAGRRTWTVSADGGSHTFRRASIWRRDQDMVVGDRVVGHVRPTSSWRGRIEADLPLLSPPSQTFVVIVLQAVWAAAAQAAASSS